MRIRYLALMLCAAAVRPASAEVLDSSSSGFTIRHVVEIAAPRTEVYLAAVHDLGKWWDDEHTVSGDADNLSIETRPTGCFCERLGEGAGLVHMTVTFINPTVMLRLSGGLGPLGLMGVAGNLTWEFDDSETGTTLTWRYAVGGYLPDGPEPLASAVDAVLLEQIRSLKTLSEQGASANP